MARKRQTTKKTKQGKRTSATTARLVRLTRAVEADATRTDVGRPVLPGVAMRERELREEFEKLKKLPDVLGIPSVSRLGRTMPRAQAFEQARKALLRQRKALGGRRRKK